MEDAGPAVSPSPLVLVVEDDGTNRLLLTRMLQRERYRVVAVGDGDTALRAISEHLPDLVVLDLNLPRMDGYEVCRRLRADRRTATLPVILLTAQTSLTDMVAGLDAGADDFVAKPYQLPELLARMKSALRLRREIARADQATLIVEALANAVEAKDSTTENHCRRLKGLAGQLGRAVGLSETDIEAVKYGALLHDVGKIGVPEAILFKPGPLTEDEQAVMRRHPVIGEHICRPLDEPRAWLPIIRGHHERWDGRGYPDGLRGTAIPIGARIIALVDAFDAMTHDRPYRSACPLDEAVTELHSLAGRQFDPELVPLLLGFIDPSGGVLTRGFHVTPGALVGRGRAS